MKNNPSPLYIFGEVLFDCFNTGEQVLGGAPFNVAWHLQALGDQPKMISRVGDDELGHAILEAMRNWKMDISQVQVDPKHPTGRVEVFFEDKEPVYRIAPECAYDFIGSELMHNLPKFGILYHGTLGVRHAVSRKALSQLTHFPELAIFMDVNLRSPWWKRSEVYDWLNQARWVKLNEHELRMLGFEEPDLEQAMARFQAQFKLLQLIVTRGEQGAIVRTQQGQIHQVKPQKNDEFVDTVGAGDAFTAVYIHGLRSGWSIEKTLRKAQEFASKVVGLRGAISRSPEFYQAFTQGLEA